MHSLTPRFYVSQPEGCVWQGLIAAAPGHPFLIKAIETVVNQVRNRFTMVDIDGSFCPEPKFKILHLYDVLYTAGPCLMGATINRVLGRDGHALYRPGEIFSEQINDVYPALPGRIIILNQNKTDMNAHRFSWKEKNIVVAATDLPDADDRILKAENMNAEGQVTTGDAASRQGDASGGSGGAAAVATDNAAKVAPGHYYRAAHAYRGVYGLENLYIDQIRANEDIEIMLNATQAWTIPFLNSAILG